MHRKNCMCLWPSNFWHNVKIKAVFGTIVFDNNKYKTSNVVL